MHKSELRGLPKQFPWPDRINGTGFFHYDGEVAQRLNAPVLKACFFDIV